MVSVSAERLAKLERDERVLDWIDLNATTESSEWRPVPSDTPGSRLWYRVSYHVPLIAGARAGAIAAMAVEEEKTHEQKLAELRAAVEAQKAERETIAAQLDEAVALHRAAGSPNIPR